MFINQVYFVNTNKNNTFAEKIESNETIMHKKGWSLFTLSYKLIKEFKSYSEGDKYIKLNCKNGKLNSYIFIPNYLIKGAKRYDKNKSLYKVERK